MKKKNLLFLASLIACVSTFGACDLFKKPEETPPTQLPPPTVNDDFIDEDWQLSGNLSDYYYVNGNGDLQQELPQSVFEVQFGESVFITTPVVVDGVGNVLEVSKKISVRGGEEITLTAGSFFAMDTIGYTVDYTIKTLDGKTHSASASVNVLGADTMWVGDGLIIDVSDLALAKQARLVNLNRSISFELTKLLSVEQKAKLEEFSKLGEIVWNIVENGQEKQVLAQTQVPVKEKVTYTVYAQLKTDDYVSVVFADVVRFYSSGSVWIDGETIFELPELITEYAPILVELNGNASYDLTNLLSKEEKTTLANYQAQGDVFWYAIMKNDMKSKSTLIANGVMNFDSMPKANYVVYARSERADGETVFIAKNVDFYDVSDGMVWNELVSNDERASSDLKIITGADTSTTSVTVADSQALGKTGVYYEVKTEGNAYAYRLNYSSAHSRAYYDMFKGQEVYLNFEIMLGSATNANGEEEILGVFGKCLGTLDGVDKYRYQYPLGSWLQVSIPIDLLVNESNPETTWENGWENGMLEIEKLFYISGAEASAKDTALYFGNVKVTQDLEKLAGSDQLIKLDGKTSYELIELFDEAQQELIESKENLQWVLVPANGGESIQSDGTIDFTVTPKGKYSIAASYAGMAVCSVNVDFYEETDGVVWADGLTANGILFKDGTPAVSVVKDPFGKTGEFYKLATNGKSYAATFLPLHGKEYYEQFAGLGAEITIEFYLVAPNNQTNVVFCGYTGGKQRTANMWLTESIALDTILKYWDVLFDPGKKGDWSHAIATGVSASDYEIYFGGFEFNVSIVGAVSDAMDRLVNVNGLTSFDTSSILSASGVAADLYDTEEVTWTFTPVNGGEAVTVVGKEVALSSVQKRVYNATATITRLGKVLTIYSGVVDFYNPTDGFVWSLMANANGAVINDGASASVVDISNEQTAFTATGTFVKVSATSANKVTLLPDHSKAYYEQYADGTMSYQFAVVANVGESPCTWATGGHYTTCADSGNTCSRCDWTSFQANSLITVNVKVSSILTNWDNLAKKAFASVGGTNFTIKGENNASIYNQTATDCTLYIGGFVCN